MSTAHAALAWPVRRLALCLAALLTLVTLPGCVRHCPHAAASPRPDAPERAVAVSGPSSGQRLAGADRMLSTADLAPGSVDGAPGTRAALVAHKERVPRAALASGVDHDFPAGARILTGFDPRTPGAGWQPGDRVLYAVRLEKGGRSQTWYALIKVIRANLQPGMRLTLDADDDRGDPASARTRLVGHRTRTLTAPCLTGRGAQWARERGLQLSPTSVLVRIDVFDEHARPIADVHQFIFSDYLQAGLYQSCDLVRRHYFDDWDPNDSDIRQVSLSFVSLFSLGELLWATPHVGQIFNEIVRLPSWISILLNLGVRPIFTIHYEQALRESRALPALADGRNAYRVPFEITLNDELALRCYVTAAPNEPPLQLCGGIVALEGADVRDPQHRFTVRLLAARQSRPEIQTASRD